MQTTERNTNRVLTTVGLLLAVFLAAVEGTAVSTVMPTIAGELGGLTLYAWVFAVYMLASSVTVPFFGKLGDQFGRKPIFIFGIIVFVAGSTLCGFARTIEELIVYRAIQGLGAGAVQPMAMTIIGDIFSLEERARVQAAFGSVWGLSGVFGPIFGSIFVEYLNWRWVFFVNIPFGLLALGFIWRYYHESIARTKHKVDFIGFVFLSITSLTLMAAAESEHPLLLYVFSALFAVAFYHIEHRAAEPLLPMGLFKTRLMVVASLVGACMGTQLYAVVTFLPLYYQAVLNKTPGQAGSLVTSVIVAWPIAAYASGRLLSRYGFRPFFILGGVLIFLGSLAVSLLVSAQSASPFIYLATYCMGSGFGLLNTALVISVQMNVRWDQRGVATASTMFFRTMGGTIAVAIMGTILKVTLTNNHSVPMGVVDSVLKPGVGSHLPAEQLAKVAQVMELGLTQIFALSVGFAFFGMLLGFFYPKGETSTPSKGTHVAAMD